MYAYDEELKVIANKCKKEVSEITETDIYDYANGGVYAALEEKN